MQTRFGIVPAIPGIDGFDSRMIRIRLVGFCPQAESMEYRWSLPFSSRPFASTHSALSLFRIELGERRGVIKRLSKRHGADGDFRLSVRSTGYAGRLA